MRELLYQAYLRYPRAFYDRHATGQVLSRATNDLYPIRYFIGWGLVQGIQSVMMIIGVGIVLVLVDAAARRSTRRVALPLIRGSSPPLRAARLADLAPGAGAEGRRDRGRGRGSRRDRDGAGVRPRGRRSGALRRQGRGRPLDRRSPGRRRVAATCRASTTSPRLSIAAVVYFGGQAYIDGQLTLGQFVVFETLLLQLVWPLEALGWITNLAQRALASAGRSFAWLEGIQPLPEPAEPRHLPGARSGSASRTSASRTAARWTSSTTSISSSSPARSSPSAVRRAPARRRSSISCRASTTRPRDASSSAASTRATCRSRSCARTSPSSRSGPSSSRCRCARTSSRAARTRTGRRRSRRLRRPASTASARRCRTATTR